MYSRPREIPTVECAVEPRSVDEMEGSLLDPNAITFGVVEETASLLVGTRNVKNEKLYPYTQFLVTTAASEAYEDYGSRENSSQYHPRKYARMRDDSSRRILKNLPADTKAVVPIIPEATELAKVTTANVKEHPVDFSPITRDKTRSMLPFEYFEYSNVHDENDYSYHNVKKTNHVDNFYKQDDSFVEDDYYASLVGNNNLESYIVAHASSISIKAKIGSDIGRLSALDEHDKIMSVNRLVISNPYHDKLRFDAAEKVARQKERERNDINCQLVSCAVHASSVSIKTKIGSNIGRLSALEEQEKVKAVNRMILSKPYHDKLRIDAAEKVARQKERYRNIPLHENKCQSMSCAAHASSVSIKTKIGSDIGRLSALDEQEKVKAVNRLILSKPYHDKLRIDAAEEVARQKERYRNIPLFNLKTNTKDSVTLV